MRGGHRGFPSHTVRPHDVRRGQAGDKPGHVVDGPPLIGPFPARSGWVMCAVGPTAVAREQIAGGGQLPGCSALTRCTSRSALRGTPRAWCGSSAHDLPPLRLRELRAREVLPRMRRRLGCALHARASPTRPAPSSPRSTPGSPKASPRAACRPRRRYSTTWRRRWSRRSTPLRPSPS